jgi:phosphatidylglycerophosphate synthase
MVTTFATLALLRALPVSLTILLIARDVCLSLLIGVVLLTTGRRPSAPTLLGRTAVFGQMSTVVSGLLFYVFDARPAFETLRPFVLTPVFIGTALLSIAAGLHYIYQVLRLLQGLEEPLGKHMSVQ